MACVCKQVKKREEELKDTREKICKYCKETNSKSIVGKRMHVLYNSYDASVSIKEGKDRKIEVKMGDVAVLTRKIKYCYMCGRKL